MTEPVCQASLGFDAAQSLLATEAEPLGTEWIPLAKAGRRVLAEEVHAEIDAPRRDVAAMDGFAVREADVAAGLRRFAVAGASYPGEGGTRPANRRTAVRIMTGAALPEAFDRVVPIECITIDGDDIVLPETMPGRTHVRARASDIRRGDLLLAPGETIDSRTMLVAAAGDIALLPVHIRPRVHVLTMGDELVEPGVARGTAASIPDSLSEAILLLTRKWGARPGGMTRQPDDQDAIRETVASLSDRADVLVMAGGASHGDRDLARTGLIPLGLELRFAGVAMKPGKPAWYGRIGAMHVIGLPGNPTAALTVARLFLVPLLNALGGRPYDAGLNWRAMPLATPAPAGGAREQFLCGVLRDSGVEIIERQEASSQLMLARQRSRAPRTGSRSPRNRRTGPSPEALRKKALPQYAKGRPNGRPFHCRAGCWQLSRASLPWR